MFPDKKCWVTYGREAWIWHEHSSNNTNDKDKQVSLDKHTLHNRPSTTDPEKRGERIWFTNHFTDRCRDGITCQRPKGILVLLDFILYFSFHLLYRDIFLWLTLMPNRIGEVNLPAKGHCHFSMRKEFLMYFPRSSIIRSWQQENSWCSLLSVSALLSLLKTCITINPSPGDWQSFLLSSCSLELFLQPQAVSVTKEVVNPVGKYSTG